MNQQLSNIELLIQQSALTDEEKKRLLKEILNAEKQWNILEFKLDRTEKVKKTTAVLLEETIEELEQKRKAVEAQNRELEIEASLERVRAVALGMKEPADMLEICRTISNQLQIQHVKEIRNVQTAIFYEDKGTYMNYEYYAKHDKTFITETTYTDNEIHNAFANQMLKGNGEIFITHIKGDQVKDWIAYQKTTNVFIDTYLETASSLNYYWYSLGPVALGVSTYQPLTEGDINLFRRFLKVFELSYTRYLDIEQAIAQAREAQIQLALERVRARTMAMQKSDELSETALLMFEQLQSFGINLWSCGFNIWEKEDNDCTSFVSRGGKMLPPVKLSLSGNPFLQLFKSKHTEEELWFVEMSGEDNRILYNYIAQQRRNSTGYNNFLSGVTLPDFQRVNVVNFSHGNLMFITLEAHPEMHDIFKRFGKVFEQTYTRFLDLQKAEAQAREAQIEAALEKVRSRSLAVYKSSEFNEVIKVVFERLQELEIPMTSASINIVIEGSKDTESYICGSGDDGLTLSHIRLIHFDHPISNDRYDAYEKGLDFFTKTYNAEEKNSFYEYEFEVSDLKYIPADIKKLIMESECYTISMALNKKSMIVVNDFEGKSLSSKQIDIVKRFSKVFEQAYIRFLDLQKAEAQARESQIELGLERVRARAMAMQTSEELNPLIGTVFTELTKLDILLTRCVILIYEGNEKGVRWWMANSETPSTPMNFFVKYADMPFFNEYFKGWYNRSLKWQYCLEGENKIKTDDFLFTETELSLLPDFVIAGMRAPDRVYLNASFNNFGNLTLASLGPLSEEHFNILLRFAKVFDLTYTRFNDLQKAEAQTRESQIQLALERVRARTMAMQKSDELSETVYVLFQQFKELGENPDQATIGVINEDEKVIEYWVTMYGNQINKVFKFSIDEPNVTNKIYKAWKENKKSLVIDLSGNALTEFMTYRAGKGGAAINPDEKRRIINVAFFSKGLLNVQSNEERSEESIKLLERFAAVFEQTYTRFLDLQKAEAQAREAQIQLALERARAQSMMMQHSTELDDTLRVFHEQVLQLSIPSAFSFLWLPDEDKDRHIFWAAWSEKNTFKSKAINYPLDRNEPATAQCLIDWKSNERVVSYQVSPDGVANYFAAWSELIAGVEQLKPEHFSDGLYYVEAFMKYGCFGVMVKQPLNDDEKKILERLAIEFERAYTRFLDLQKAEAQAREAQIEAALERVRSRTMAMHKSSELLETAELLFDQLKQLGAELQGVAFAICDKDSVIVQKWTSIGVFPVPYTIDPGEQRMYEAWKNQAGIYEEVYEGERQKKYYESFMEIPAFKQGIQKFIEEGHPIPTWQKNHAITFQHGYLLFITTKPFNETQIFLRFGKVFEQTYTRFLDLQKAEAQARESEIELALERVRARTMAMQKSAELKEVIQLVYEQFVHLNIHIEHTGFIVDYKVRNDMNIWLADQHEVPFEVTIPYFDCTHWNSFLEAKEKGKDFFANHLSFEEKNKFYQDLFKLIPGVSDEAKEYYLSCPGLAISTVLLENVGLYIENFSGIPYTDEENNTLMRFGKVFQQTYTRFLDLQKAELQAREAQIELSLERVRAKTMAMHNSQDVGKTVATMFDELLKLGIETLRCGIGIMQQDNKMEVWTAKSEINGKVDLIIGRLDMNMHPLLQGAYHNWKNKKDSFSYELEGEDLLSYFTAINNYTDYPVKYDISSLPLKIIHNDFYFAEGSLFVFSVEKLSPEANKIFKRFAAVFGQTYRRYLDLQTAEAQAKEAQIEAALERVRASAMAMHTSEGILEVVHVLREQVAQLGEKELESILVHVYHEDRDEFDAWYAYRQPESSREEIINAKHNLDWSKTARARKDKENYYGNEADYTIVADYEMLKEWYQYLLKVAPEVVELDDKGNILVPDVLYYNYSKFSGGTLLLITNSEASQQSKYLLKRAAKVFNLAYSRFLDLKQAEALAKEAKIEAALERVRGKAMAMQNSNDVSVAASMVFTELKKLGINPIRCGVGILNKESRKAQLYSATSSQEGDSLSLVGWVMLAGHPVLKKIYDTWLSNEDYYPELSGEQLKSYYELLLAGLSVPVPNWKDEQKQYGHFLSFSVGCLYAWSDAPYNDTEIKILKRFAGIIDLTFRRYFELQNSEANAREAVKQAALDRIRADIASMRTVSDLDRITPLIWNELTILGIPFIRCGVFIMDDSEQLMHTFLSTPDGKAIAAFHLPYTTPGNIQKVISHWHDNKNYIDHWDENAFTEFAKTLVKQGALTSAQQYLQTIPHGGFYLHFLPFFQGMLYVGNNTQLGEEEINLIQSVADAFSTAYARYEDFNKLEAAKQQVEKTLTDLKQTQQQLVQSEKMASLGELTAGIAHEIQNPLNFVNNFSEVNKEMLEELKDEIEKGNTEEAKALANDVIENEEKINHHGKRADAIVKGMLQHSRRSSLQKEPTDINALCDEYIRLCFHGLRAKDKSFNSGIVTDFDKTIGKINIIPQDISRVILNILTNAFYAVNEKLKGESLKQNADYKPTVTVRTKKINGEVEIIIADNGNGIPQNIIDKIFQPFFTTKPTGVGTGLGLSLSYDIIKAHGGEIKVETKEGEGSKFIIQLPITL